MTDPAPLAGELGWLTLAPPLIAPPPGCDSADAILRYCAGEPGVLRRAAGTLAELPRPRRLGLHFENLVAAVIQHSQRYRLVARNVPLRVAGKTLGELDMLVEDRDTGDLMHWELALKFYLGLPGEPEERAWPGPNNPKDQLTRKIDHLYHQQLPRSTEPAVAALLAEQGLHVDRRLLLTRGRLFYPAGGSATPPAEVTEKHERGTWRYGPAPDQTAVIPHGLWHYPAGYRPEGGPTNSPAAGRASMVLDATGEPVFVLSETTETT